MTTDISEKGLETLMIRHMTGTDGLAVIPNRVAERPPPYGGTGYTAGSAQDYDRAHALDVPQLFGFLRATQPQVFKKLAMADRHLRAEEQSHQADGGGRGRAVPPRPRPARAPVRVRPLRSALRGGRQRGADVHRACGQALVVPALQQGLPRRRGQPAQPVRPQ